MPKFIAHALIGAGIVAAIHPTASVKKWIPLAAGAILAISPDFDYVVEWLFNLSEFHRGFSHSIFCSLIIGFLIWLVMRAGDERAMISYSLAYLSHTFLDFLASTTGGVKFFYPFSDLFYNLGLTDLFETPLGNNFSEVFYWMAVETVCFLPPLIVLLKLKDLKTKNQ